MSLFGLGAPELAVIGVIGAFIFGPQKLTELGKDVVKKGGELKEVPKESQDKLSTKNVTSNKGADGNSEESAKNICC